MKRTALRAIVLSGMTALMSHVVGADTNNVDPVSITNTQTIYDQLTGKAALSYMGIYRGASLGDLGNSLQPTEDGRPNPTTPQSIESYVTTGYKLNPDLMLGVAWHFFYYPIGNPPGSGQDLQMRDPALVLSQGNLIKNGGFKLTGKLFAQLPVSSADILKPQHYAAALFPTFIASYDVPHTDLSLGVYTYIRYDIPTGLTPNMAQTYKIYVAPNLNYQISKTVAATLWMDLIQATRNGGTGFISGISNDTADIEPGIAWDIFKNVTFNPMINIYPSKPTLAATSLQAIVIAKAF